MLLITLVPKVIEPRVILVYRSMLTIMGKPGPDRDPSNDRLLLELLGIEQQAAFAGQINERVNHKATQSTRDRLNNLVENTEYVTMKKVSGRNLYSLTDEGREHIMNTARSKIN